MSNATPHGASSALDGARPIHYEGGAGGRRLAAPILMRTEGTPSRWALLAAWGGVVGVLWFGLFVRSMRPDVSDWIAIDLGGYFFPKFVLASAELARGELPLWNPYDFSGMPLLGAGQPAALYPPRVVLFGVLPPVWALHSLMVVQHIDLGLGTFWALR